MEIPWPTVPKLTADEVLHRLCDRSAAQTVELSGKLTATRLFSCLAEAEDSPRGVLLHAEPPVAEKLGTAGAAAYAGSMVLYAGNARVVGELGTTGLPMFPLCLSKISDLTFEAPHGGTLRFQLTVRRLSVYLRTPAAPTPEQLKRIAALRPTAESWRELRERLGRGERYLIADDLEPEAAAVVVQRLHDAGLTHWETAYYD